MTFVSISQRVGKTQRGDWILRYLTWNAKHGSPTASWEPFLQTIFKVHSKQSLLLHLMIWRDPVTDIQRCLDQYFSLLSTSNCSSYSIKRCSCASRTASCYILCVTVHTCLFKRELRLRYHERHLIALSCYLNHIDIPQDESLANHKHKSSMDFTSE